MVSIQIGDVYGDLKSLEMQENQTLKDALQQAGMRLQETQQILANSDSRTVSVNDLVTDNEVYLLAGREEDGLY